MGYRIFCDQCEKEINRNYVSQRLMTRLDNWHTEIMIGHHGKYNDGVLCKDCVLRIINQGEEDENWKRAF